MQRHYHNSIDFSTPPGPALPQSQSVSATLMMFPTSSQSTDRTIPKLKAVTSHVYTIRKLKYKETVEPNMLLRVVFSDPAFGWVLSLRAASIHHPSPQIALK